MGAQDERNSPSKAEQADLWGRAALGWSKWWPMIEQGARPVSERMLARTGLGPGERVLDLACGVGEPTVTAARRVGPVGRVLATDLSPTMLELARKRIDDHGLENVEFHQMDAEHPNLEPAAFDVVLSRWGLMFVGDLGRCLTKVRRLLAPGGRIGLAVWAPPRHAPSLSLATRVLTEHLDLPPPAPDERGPFELSDQAALEAELAAAGFTDIGGEPVAVVYRFESPDAFVTFRREVSTIDEKLKDHPRHRVEAAWQAVARASEAYRTADGQILMENRAICLSARVAGVR